MPNLNRFIRVGQNTPLTCVFMAGFEYNDQARDKIQSLSGVLVNSTSTPSPHQNAGNGGSRYAKLNSTNARIAMLGHPQLREYVLCYAAHLPAGSSSAVDMRTSTDSTGQTRVQHDEATGIVTFRRGTTSLASSAASAFVAGQWNWVHCWAYVDNAAGFGHVRIGSWANLVTTITGVDTQAHASDSFADQLSPTSLGSVANFDDMMVFARSMYYSGGAGGAGVPVVGNTLTGGTSGATLLVTHVFDNGSGSGCVFVRTVSGTFQAGETLANGAGWTATAGNALGNNEASLWVREQYHMLMATNSDVAAGWTSSTGASHFTEVDDSATLTDFVSTNTANQVDEYGTGLTLPPGAEIEAVCASVYARLNGVSAVNNIRPGIDDGAGDMDAEVDSALSGAWEVHDLIFTRNPHTGTRFTTTEVGNLNLRITSKA